MSDEFIATDDAENDLFTVFLVLHEFYLTTLKEMNPWDRKVFFKDPVPLLQTLDMGPVVLKESADDFVHGLTSSDDSLLFPGNLKYVGQQDPIICEDENHQR